MTRKTVWLVRHAEADVPSGMAIGRGDPLLTPRGELQAEWLAERLAARTLQRVYSSDLKRALMTADRIAARHRLTVETCSELREIDFGAWEGRALGDLWSEEPEEAAAWEGDLRCVPRGFGERFEDLESRVARFMRRLHDCRFAAVVAHRGPLLVLLQQLTGMSIADAWRQELPLGSLLRVSVSSSARRLNSAFDSIYSTHIVVQPWNT